MTKRHEPLAIALSIAFTTVAAFHLVALFVPDLGEPSPALRHVVFIAVNALFAALFGRAGWEGRASRLLVVPVAILVVQQAVSHGIDLWRARDLQSVVVLLALPVVVFATYRLVRVN